MTLGRLLVTVGWAGFFADPTRGARVPPFHEDDKVTLWRGDSLAILRDIPTGSIDALVTDPPYSSGGMVRGDRMATADAKYVGFGAAGGDHQDFTGDNRDQRAYAYWCTLWLGECLRIVKPGGVALLFTDWRQLPTTTDALQSGGWVWRGIVPWVKPFARPHRGRFKAQAEYVAWGSHGPIKAVGDCLPGFFEGSAPRERDHMTQKPLDVMRGLLQIVPPGGVVLDPFMGSGTTGVAALIEGRRFVGIELAPHHAEVAERRICSARGRVVPDGMQDCFDLGDPAA